MKTVGEAPSAMFKAQEKFQSSSRQGRAPGPAATGVRVKAEPPFRWLPSGPWHFFWALCFALGALLSAFAADNKPASTRRAPIGTNDIIILSDDGGRYRPPVAVYRGNVRVTDTQVALTCELLTIYFQTNSEKLDMIIAETNVVISQKGTIAFADKIVYTATNDVIVLTGTLGDAMIDAPQGWWTGGMIIYDRKDNSIYSPGPLKMGGPVKGGLFGTNTLGLGLPGTLPVETKSPAAKELEKK